MNKTKYQLYTEFYQLMYQIRPAMEQKVKEFMDKEKITALQTHALRHMLENPNSTITELAKALSTSPSALVQLTDRLAELKLIERVNDLKDRRITRIVGTKKGEEELLKLKNLSIEKLASIFDALTEVELQTINNIFKKLLNKLKK
ncbi:MarR family transcriptional regulator [Candidatus Beckwithbacteria bacterium]|nr:MarR family transcriptional regulator [Candidatus Beckwithbacteria bacterium]